MTILLLCRIPTFQNQFSSIFQGNKFIKIKSNHLYLVINSSPSVKTTSTNRSSGQTPTNRALNILINSLNLSNSSFQMPIMSPRSLRTLELSISTIMAAKVNIVYNKIIWLVVDSTSASSRYLYMPDPILSYRNKMLKVILLPFPSTAKLS